MATGMKPEPQIHKTESTTRQGARRAASRRRFQGMTQAEILRSLSDNEINKYAKRGAQGAIMEQAYRINFLQSLTESNDTCSEFERCCMIESETRKGGI